MSPREFTILHLRLTDAEIASAIGDLVAHLEYLRAEIQPENAQRVKLHESNRASHAGFPNAGPFTMTESAEVKQATAGIEEATHALCQTLQEKADPHRFGGSLQAGCCQCATLTLVLTYLLTRYPMSGQPEWPTRSEIPKHRKTENRSRRRLPLHGRDRRR